MKIIWGIIKSIGRWINNNRKTFLYSFLGLCLILSLTLIGGKTYQHLDNDKDRGGYAFEMGAFDESHTTPIYLEQGWRPSDSMWFYNTTQGSNLLPYDFFVVLEEAESEQLLRSDKNVDKFRYLPQKATFFNPDALPLGFVKDSYDGDDYVGLTCAACHTGQINYQGQAIRIDGGPAMADMDGFLAALESSMVTTLNDVQKRDRFVENVIARRNDYRKAEHVVADLEKWTKIIQHYNIINHSRVDYGYARLDAFGRIYNRVLKYIINRDQLERRLLLVRKANKEHLLSRAEVNKVLAGIDDTIIGRDQYLIIVERLMSDEPGYPGLGVKDILRLRDNVFNEPNAPVSYPFLWGTTHSDYVQWNGIAKNSGAGPLGRNVGEVMGVFASLDWSASTPWYAGLNIPARVSGQDKNPKSSILNRL